MKVNPLPRPFKFAAGFLVFGMVCVWGVVAVAGGENRALMVPLAMTTCGSSLMAALCVLIGLTDERLVRAPRLPRGI